MRSRLGVPSGKRVDKTCWPGRVGVAPVVGCACDTVTRGGETTLPAAGACWEGIAGGMDAGNGVIGTLGGTCGGCSTSLWNG